MLFLDFFVTVFSNFKKTYEKILVHIKTRAPPKHYRALGTKTEGEISTSYLHLVCQERAIQKNFSGRIRYYQRFQLIFLAFVE